MSLNMMRCFDIILNKISLWKICSILSGLILEKEIAWCHKLPPKDLTNSGQTAIVQGLKIHVFCEHYTFKTGTRVSCSLFYPLACYRTQICSLMPNLWGSISETYLCIRKVILPTGAELPHQNNWPYA